MADTQVNVKIAAQGVETIQAELAKVKAALAGVSGTGTAGGGGGLAGVARNADQTTRAVSTLGFGLTRLAQTGLSSAEPIRMVEGALIQLNPTAGAAIVTVSLLTAGLALLARKTDEADRAWRAHLDSLNVSGPGQTAQEKVAQLRGEIAKLTFDLTRAAAQQPPWWAAILMTAAAGTPTLAGLAGRILGVGPGARRLADLNQQLGVSEAGLLNQPQTPPRGGLAAVERFSPFALRDALATQREDAVAAAVRQMNAQNAGFTRGLGGGWSAMPAAMAQLQDITGPTADDFDRMNASVGEMLAQAPHLDKLAIAFGKVGDYAVPAFQAATDALTKKGGGVKAALKAVLDALRAEFLAHAAGEFAAGWAALASPFEKVSAAAHFKSAALYTAAAGVAGAMGAGGSGGGGAYAGSSYERSTRDVVGQRGEVTFVLQGGRFLDMSDPRQLEAFRRAMEEFSGRRIVLREGT